MARKLELREGLYRDRKDRSYVLYLFEQEGGWRFQIPGTRESYNFQLALFNNLEPIDKPFEELERFKKIASFLEDQLEEEIERRRDL